MHIIIDGYNLIRQVPELAIKERQSLEVGRDNLIGLLGQYKKIKRHKITIVFDGVLNMSEFAPSFLQSGIRVCFAPGPKTADDVIREKVSKNGGQALVVSSDNAVIGFAKANGSAYMSSPEFYSKVQMARFMAGEVGAEEPEVNSQPVHKRWATKKKGPAKRLPKKERKNRVKTKKV